MFTRVSFQNPDVCKHLLEILLEIEIDHIEMANEEQHQVDYESKGVRLKTSYVIFICIDDIFNCGLPVYSFENICREDNKIKLNDMSYKYFFISKNCDKLLNAEQKSFLKLITENKPSDNFTREIINLVNEAKTKFGWSKVRLLIP